jgi:TPR repeat protein
MANVVSKEPFFELRLDADCEKMQTKPYSRAGRMILIFENEVSPIVKKTFHELHEAHFQAKQFPYPVVLIECKNSMIACDGQAACGWLGQSFTNPITQETAVKVHLFTQGMIRGPFLQHSSCEGNLSPDMKTVILALSCTDSPAVRAARKDFLATRPPYNMHYQDMLPLFNEALKYDPNDPSLLLALASMYLEGSGSLKKDFKKVEELSRAVLKIQQDNAEALLNLGKIYRIGFHGIQKNLKEAKACLLLAHRAAPADNDILSALVSFYCKDDDPREALKLLEGEMKANSKNVFAMNRLALLYKEGVKGIPPDLEYAAKLWEDALVVDPQNIEIHTSLANLYRYGSEKFAPNKPRAIVLFRKILQINPNHDCTLYSLGNMLYLGDCNGFYDLKEAAALLEKAHSLDKTDDSILASLGQLYYLGGPSNVPVDLQKAARCFAEALELNPKNEYVPRLYGQLLADGAQGVPQDFPRAAKLLEDALKINPNEVNVIFKLATLYLSGKILENLPRATELFKKLYELAPDKMREIKFYTKQLPEAIVKLFQQALMRDPNDILVLEILGALLLDNTQGLPENDDEGVRFLQAVCRLQPKTVWPRLFLGDFYLEGGKHIKKDGKKALSFYEEALALSQENDISILSKYAALLFNGTQVAPNFARAEELVERILKLNKKSNWAWAFLGDIHRIGGHGVRRNRKRALECYTEGQKIAPKDPDVLMGLGYLYINGDGDVPTDLNQARFFLEQAKKITPNDQRLINGFLAVEKKAKAAPNLLELIFSPSDKKRPPNDFTGDDVELPDLHSLRVDDSKEEKIDK